LNTNDTKKEESRSAESAAPLSNEEVGRFLMKLAAIYKDEKLGNPQLADALTKIAQSLHTVARISRPNPKRSSEIQGPGTRRLDLEQMDTEAIKLFASDENKTKRELLDLAISRFSIPRAKLQRLPLAEVRNAIFAALHHEESLKIISEEAERNGRARNS
jgi:hypothetical protein